MDKCEICGERIDWNNPNIHYGVHSCDTKKLNKIGAKERYIKSSKESYTPILDSNDLNSFNNLNESSKELENNKFKQNIKLSWKDVFDGYKLFPSDYNTCLKYLKPTRYIYIAFNNSVYRIDDLNMSNPICSDDDLR